MKTYQQLADYIASYAITRGRTKGNAPVNRVVHSAQEFIRYADGEGSDIVGFFNHTQMFTMTPQGVLTVHGKPYECPSVNGYMELAVGLNYRRKPFKGVNHRVVNVAEGRDYYLVKDNMVFNPDGTVQKPVEFVGRRVDRQASAQLRESVTPFANMFALWLTPDAQGHKYIKFKCVKDAFTDTDQWESLFEYLALLGRRKYVNSVWTGTGGRYEQKIDPRFYEPKAYIKEILMPELTIHELFATGVYSLPYYKTKSTT